MKNVSEWFAGLSQEDRKRLVCFFFSIRVEAQKLKGGDLFLELLKVLDDEYHSLKD